MTGGQPTIQVSRESLPNQGDCYVNSSMSGHTNHQPSPIPHQNIDGISRSQANYTEMSESKFGDDNREGPASNYNNMSSIIHQNPNTNYSQSYLNILADQRNSSNVLNNDQNQQYTSVSQIQESMQSSQSRIVNIHGDKSSSSNQLNNHHRTYDNRYVDQSGRNNLSNGNGE